MGRGQGVNETGLRDGGGWHEERDTLTILGPVMTMKLLSLDAY